MILINAKISFSPYPAFLIPLIPLIKRWDDQVLGVLRGYFGEEVS